MFVVCLIPSIPVLADDFMATNAPVGRAGDVLVTPVNQLVTPAGTLVELPKMRPQALALSPDDRLLVTSGLTNELAVIDPASGKLLQVVAFPADQQPEQAPVSAGNLGGIAKAQMSYAGLKFSPDGARIYLSTVTGVVEIFAVGRDQKISPEASLRLPAFVQGKHTNDIATGIAVSADGRKLYVCGNLSNRLFEMDAVTGAILGCWDVGVAPFDVVLAGHKLYVSNWGGRRPDAGSVTGPAGLGTRVRADVRGIALEGSVDIIDLAQKWAPPREIVFGPHTSAMALSPNGRWLAVASTGNDLLSIIDTRSDEVVETVSARQNPADLFGEQPDALAFDSSGKKLYCANGTQNAIAVFDFRPRETALLGLIPAGWFPGAVAYDARDKRICVANLKTVAMTPEKARLGATGLGFNTKQYGGTVSLVPVPSKIELEQMTGQALANLRYPLLTEARLPARSARPAVPVPERVGERTVFNHVIYIVKENRTYDQVLGDVTNGNGDAALCNFGQAVTPNEHKLVREFALLDNTYCSGILSADGHNWTDSALASDYVERMFAGWVRSYPAGGDGEGGADALAYSPAGFIWDDALAHGRSFHDFGEYTTTIKHRKSSGATNDVSEKISWAEAWQDFKSGTNGIDYTCEPDIESLRPFMEKNWASWDLDVPDQVRAAKFIQRLKAYESAGGLPALTIIWLPNDHTSGIKTNCPTPKAQVADNDLAVGKVVEAVSHSKFWKDTCLFAIEDDPQNGWDHVSGYRTTAYVISPYTRRGAVVSTQYNTTSMLRTMELILGLPPMNQMDATATPMFDCFTNVADLTPYDAVTNNIPLDQMNPKRIREARQRRDAALSARLPLDKPDQCNEDVLNRILWRATMGNRPYPEWAVKVVDED